MTKMANDNVIVLTVIWFLGVGFVGGLFGLFALSWRGVTTPEGVATIVSTMGGALAAILTTTRAHRGESVSPQPVEVTNTQDNAVPVEAKES